MKRYTVEDKARLVEEISKTTLPIKQACAAAGISDGSYYHWKKELEVINVAMEQVNKVVPSDKELFENRIEIAAAKKKGPPKIEIDERVEKLVVDLKKKYPYYGVVRISQELLRFECVKISPTKVLKVLDKNNLNTSDFYGARRTKEVVRFERNKPNELWSTDIMPYKLKNGDRFYFIGIEDDFSRYILAHGVFEDAKMENVIKVLQTAVAAYGLPKEILTDRGAQFHSWKGMSGFEELLARYGIKHAMARAHNPSCNGKIESVHRNLQKELLWRKYMENWQEATTEIGKYIDYYNHERPHQGIGGLVPADRYFKIGDEVKKHVLKANLEGVKVYFTGKIDGTMYRIEQIKDEIKLYVGGNALGEGNDLKSIPDAINALGSILKQQNI